jgi:hypothetical protein
VIVLPGGLNADKLKNLSWDEEIKPITSETSVGGITLTLDDLVAASGPASGQNVWTWLFSRRSRGITKSPLSAAISATDASVVVASGTGFPAGDQIIWIDREAIHCSARAGAIFTVAASGRGYLGTHAAAHTPDTANAFAPVVWAEFPNPQRRRAILWMVQGTTATAIYRGYLGRAPRLDQGGARWEVQIDHAITVQSNRALGPSKSTVRISGFDVNTLSATFIQLGGAGATVAAFNALREPITTIEETLRGAVRILADRLRDMLASVAAGGITVAVHGHVTQEGLAQIIVDSSTVRHSLFFTWAHVAPGSVVPDRVSDASEPWESPEVSAGRFTSRRTLGYHCTAHAIARRGRISTLPLDSVAGIPTSNLFADYNDGAIATRVAWSLSGNDSAGWPFLFRMFTVDAATRRVTGILLNPATGARPTVQGDILFTDITSVNLVTQVESGHWLRAIQRGALSADYGLDDQADTRDWDWSSADDVISATGGEYSASRLWVFDGSQKLGDFFKDALRLDACAIALKTSRLSIVSLGPPLPTETAALTLDLTAGAGIHQAPPWFSSLPEGIVNVVRLTRQKDDTTGPPSITINNQTSIALFGMAPPLELEAKGAAAQIVGDRTPFELARGPFARLLGLWGIPSDMIRVATTIDALSTVELGAIVDITSKTLPDGQGHRGVSTTRRGRVYRRGVGFQDGRVTLDVLIYGADRVAGYAPACRVSTITGTSNNVITVATGYLSSSATATDYAGSNSASYPGTANDGGVSKFAVGQYLKFRRVDSTSMIEEGGFQITVVNAAAKQITVTPDATLGATNWVARLAAGDMIDVIADDFANATTTQRGYAYIGEKTTGEITSGTSNQEWAP